MPELRIQDGGIAETRGNTRATHEPRGAQGIQRRSSSGAEFKSWPAAKNAQFRRGGPGLLGTMKEPVRSSWLLVRDRSVLCYRLGSGRRKNSRHLEMSLPGGGSDGLLGGRVLQRGMRSGRAQPDGWPALPPALTPPTPKSFRRPCAYRRIQDNGASNRSAR